MSEESEPLELFAVPDMFVSGLASIESVGGGNLRFTLYALQKVDGRNERVVVGRIIMSAEAVPDAMHMTAVRTGACACLNARLMARN
jgi:hypothetical protein